MSLSVAGAQMQTILDNPLADPFTLGISSAASFGAAMAFVWGFNVLPPIAATLLVAGNAFALALVAAAMVWAVSRMRGVYAIEAHIEWPTDEPPRVTPIQAWRPLGRRPG